MSDMSNTRNMASDEIRRDNSKAVRARQTWRERYAELGFMIRECKDGDKALGPTRRSAINLRLLQAEAVKQMNRRDEIKAELIRTNYKYV